MSKFYVVSNELQRIVIADTPQQAAAKAIDSVRGETIDKFFFYIDERGFRVAAAAHKIPIDNVIRTEGLDGGETA